MSTTVDVCVVGSANLDLVATAPRHPSPGETVHGTGYAEFAGGKGLNQAVAAARSGAATAFVGAIGHDDAGVRLAAVLDAETIDTAGLATVDDPTGRAVIVVDATGENSIVVVAGANAQATVDDPIDAAVVLSQLEVPVATVIAGFRLGRAAGATTVLNPAPAMPLPPDLLHLCDVIIPNEHEVELIGGAEQLLTDGCRAVIVTRGAAGADIHRLGVDPVHVDAFPVEVVDTTGAGDAFCGSFAARVALGDDVETAVEWAAAAGALATTRPGAVPAQPTASAVRALLREHER